MAHAQLPVADAAADADELYVGVGIGHVHLCLLVASGGEKTCRRKAVGLFPTVRQARGDTHQILLRNAHLHGLFRECIEKGGHGSGASRIRTQCDNTFIFFGVSHKGLADYLPVWNFIHAALPPSSRLKLSLSARIPPAWVRDDAMPPCFP